MLGLFSSALQVVFGMDIKELLTSFAQITIFAVMLSMGMALGFNGIARLWRRPSLLVRCLLAAFVVVPLVAMAVVKVLPLSFDVKAGILAMAVIPGAPVTYRKMLRGPGDHELAGSFQATTALLSIVVVPLWFGTISDIDATLATAPLGTVFRQVMLLHGLPLLCGAAINHWLPELAEDLDQPLNRISTAMLIAVVLLVLVIGLPIVLKAGLLPVLAIVFMATTALLSGHYLGSSDPITRQTIAVANATRNAGLAIALIALNFPQAEHAILTTIATYAVISTIAGKIYNHLYQKRIAVASTAKTTS
jgi:BASS family bile acid:Na+ symporter